MHFQGVVRKMTTEYSSVINYFIEFENSYIHLNQFLERSFTIECIGYSCLSCSSKDDIFRQGFCKRCFFESPLAGDWIIRPELSKAHLNIADRDLDYEKKIQLQPHIVYLSNTGSVKVGITRKSQLPHRWIDQGAHEAIEIIEEAIQDAPSVKQGMLQAQVLKYLLRLWLKDNSRQDAEKARWYLNRLIDSL